MKKFLCWFLLLMLLISMFSSCQKDYSESEKINQDSNPGVINENNKEFEIELVEKNPIGEIDYSHFKIKSGFSTNSFNLFPFTYRNKVGYADINGNIIVNSKYVRASYFSENKAFVETIDGSIQIINDSFDVLYEFDKRFKNDFKNSYKYSNIVSCLGEAGFKNNMLIFTCPNIRTGEIVIYSFCDTDGVINVERNIINNNQLRINWNGSISQIYADTFLGLKLSNPFTDVGTDLSETTIFDLSGKVILQYSKENIITTKRTAFDNFKQDPPICINGSYINAMNDDGMWGIIDINTKEVIVDYKYDYIGEYNENCISVCSFGKWGAINKSGETVIPFEYDYIGNFRNGKAFAIKNGLECYIINTNGETEYKYDDTRFLIGHYGKYLPSDFYNSTGIAKVKNEDDYYLISNTGKILLQLKKNDAFISNNHILANDTMYEIVFHNSIKKE